MIPPILIETFNRLFKSKSPAFFIRIRIIIGSLAFANYIPSMIQRWFDVSVSGGTINLCEDIAKYCTGIFVALFLPTDSKNVAITDEGKLLKTTDESKLPFTAKQEAKEEVKRVESLPEIPAEAIKE